MKSYNLGMLTKRVYESSSQMFSIKSLRETLNIENTDSFFKLVKRLLDGEVISKIERGKYVLKNYSGSEFLLANFIYEPSYVSFESALSYHGVLSQFPYEVTSATIKQTRTKEFGGRQYSYYKIKKDLFWGYTKNDNYLVADREKALTDQMYFASKGIKKAYLEEYDLSMLNRKKLESYIVKYPPTRQFKESVETLTRYLKI